MLPAFAVATPVPRITPLLTFSVAPVPSVIAPVPTTAPDSNVRLPPVPGTAPLVMVIAAKLLRVVFAPKVSEVLPPTVVAPFQIL